MAKDLSAVFRVGDNIEPALIYGSVQTMMDAETWPEFDDEDYENGEDEAAAEISYDPYPLVSVGADNGTFLNVGESTRFRSPCRGICLIRSKPVLPIHR